MACTRYQTAIQELIDGSLGAIRAAELEQHLAGCAACRSLAADLRKIRDMAGTLEHPRPPDHVWLQIAGRLRQEGRAQPSPAARSNRYAALVAIAAALVLAIGASMVVVLRTGNAPDGGAPPAAAAGNAADADAVSSIEAEFRLAEQHYQNAIARLEEAATSGQSAIDPQTAAMLRKNLEVIDQAIEESRSALRSEPQSVPARASLFDALKQKVALLQDAIALMNKMRTGDSAGAAEIVGGLDKS